MYTVLNISKLIN